MLSAVTSGVDYVRIGAEQTCAEPYRSRLLPNWAAGDERLVALRDRLAAVPVVVGTVATLTAHAELFRLKRFTAAIVDEAAQILEPQLLGLLCCAPDGEPAIRKFVMIGDHRQLPRCCHADPGVNRGARRVASPYRTDRFVALPLRAVASSGAGSGRRPLLGHAGPPRAYARRH